MYNINWSLLIARNTYIGWITSIRMAWLNVIIKPVKDLYDAFILYRATALYKLNFNGQIIYLEHILNDVFDNANRGIYIDNTADLNRVYLFNSSELVTPVYVYNNYDAAIPYVVGEFSVYDNKVWVCSNNTTGNTPGVSSSYWNFDSDVLFLENESEYQSNYDFIVMVPAAVVFDINAMKSLVNYYRCAGKRFTIQTF